MKAAATPSSAALGSRSAVDRNALALRLAAVAGDQDGGDDEQRAERAEPHRHVRRQRLKVGDNEGNDEQRADSETADAAIFGHE